MSSPCRGSFPWLNWSALCRHLLHYGPVWDDYCRSLNALNSLVGAEKMEKNSLHEVKPVSKASSVEFSGCLEMLCVHRGRYGAHCLFGCSDVPCFLFVSYSSNAFFFFHKTQDWSHCKNHTYGVLNFFLAFGIMSPLSNCKVVTNLSQTIKTKRENTGRVMLGLYNSGQM